MAAVRIRGTTYPVLLPKLRDPRLHLAATITSLQVIGQLGFRFEVSIAQILLAIGTAAVLEVAIAFRTQRVVLWPASAMLTGNGVAFVLREPHTVHGDWWSTRGWWIFVGASALSLLSKHLIRWRGEHVFNPSNLGLVVCFLALGRHRAAPLDFWWGPTSAWLAVALAVIVTGGFAILWRLRLLRVALGFWVAFAAGTGAVALAGHGMEARWHLGPVSGFHLWWVLVTSPEVLVFLFFMITDPKTAPRSASGRLAYAVALGLLAAVMIAPTTSEYAAKVALLGALAIVCLALPLLRELPLAPSRRLALAAAPALVAAGAAVLVLGNATPRASAAAPMLDATLPPIAILPSPGVQTQLDRRTADAIAGDLVAARPAAAVGGGTFRISLQPGIDQGPPLAVVRVADAVYRLRPTGDGTWALPGASPRAPVVAAPASDALAGVRLTDVARSVGLDLRQGSFRFGVSNDYRAMMGGGLCWLDYNGDGWQDLFVVNSYASSDTAAWQAHGGLPRTALFENLRGRFRNVTARAHAGLPVQGDGCVAADLNGDGRPDLVVTTTTGVDVLWNGRGGRFAASRLPASGWYAGAAVADVNGDGRPDLFVAGYADPNQPVPNSLSGFPTNLAGVRDLLYLNEGGGPDGRTRFREVGAQAGLESAAFRHGLGATFLDANGDGRPDLYVANDEDPNQLYVNVPWPGGAGADPAGLGFRFEERAAAAGVADPYAGMGVAASGSDLFVSNSRDEPAAAFRLGRAGFANARSAFDPALGTRFAGWGASFVDLANSGSPDLVLATGAIPVRNLARDAEPLQVLAPAGRGRFGVARGVVGMRLNGRGLAAADVDDDGRVEIAVNSIGGRLVLLRPTGPSGHWLDVALSRFSPGAVVTAVLPDGRRLSRTVRAGSSYLSSEDPRVHLGLGSARSVRELIVRYPWGGASRLTDVRADRVVTVAVPAPRVPAARPPASYRLASCTPSTHGVSAATLWDETAVAALRTGAAPQPVQARDLFDLSAAMWDAWAAYSPAARGYFVHEKARAADVARARDTATAYAAYRLLLWRASLDSNLARTFALLTARMRSLCYSPDFTATSGGSPAALGNRIAAAAIAAGRRDGSSEATRYADPGYAPQNAPLIVSQPGSTVHDATFWQPLALGSISPHGLGSVPAKVQSFVGAQWGRVRTFATPPSVGAPPLGLPSGRAYEAAAVAVLRATARPHPAGPDASPLAWNARAAAVATGRPAVDVRLYLALNGALNDAAVAAWRAKREYQAPRPISMIRYLAFNGQLPVVAGLTRRSGSRTLVRLDGRWVDGARWTPPGATPPSPGWVSSDAAFAYAAGRVLGALTGRSFDAEAGRAASAGLAQGTELAIDVAGGRRLGLEVGRRALARARQLAPTG